MLKLCRLEQKIHVDGVVWKDDLPVIGLGQQSCVEQRGYVAMHGLDIAPGAPSGFADGHGGGAGQCVQQFPAFAREHFEQQGGRFEADARRSGLGALPCARKIAQRFRQRTDSIVTMFILPAPHILEEIGD